MDVGKSAGATYETDPGNEVAVAPQKLADKAAEAMTACMIIFAKAVHGEGRRRHGW